MNEVPPNESFAEEPVHIPWLTGSSVICGTLGIPAFLLGGILFATLQLHERSFGMSMTLIPSALAVVLGALARRREPAQRGLAAIGIILGGAFLLFGACLLFFGGPFPDL